MLTITLLFAGLLSGIIVARLKVLPAGTAQWINQIIIFLLLPAVILLKAPTLLLDANAAGPVILCWSVILISAVIILAAARIMQWPRAVTGALLLVAPLSNSAYLGIPLVEVILGDEALPYAMLYDQFGNFLALSIYAAFVVATFSSAGAGFSITRVVWSIFRFPPFLALLFALLVLRTHPPGALVQDVLAALGLLMAPLAAFIVGHELRFKVPLSLLKPLATGLVLGLLFAPLLVFAGQQILNLSGPAFKATLLQAAMPPMITAGLIGIQAGFNRDLIIAMLSIGTLLSILTLAGLTMLTT